MPSPNEPEGTLAFGQRPALELSAETQRLLNGLLLHKAAIASSWSQWLVRQNPDEEFRRVVGEIMLDSADEASRTVPCIAAWSELKEGSDRLADAAHRVESHFIQAFHTIKRHTAEAYLAAAMSAPTDEIRQGFLQLADDDRRHDDSLRRLLRRPTVPEQRERLESGMGGGGHVGAHNGQGDQESLRSRVEKALDRLRPSRAEAVRLQLSANALRRLRDEGAVDADAGTVLGLPADIDFGWQGECFAIETGERVSFAEIVTSLRAKGGSED